MRQALIFVMAFLSAGAMAQIETPQPSPLSTVSQKVGLTDVSITYSRPSAKGRKVFGDVVPLDKMWRTGANRSTKLTLSDTASINGVNLPKGDYSIFTVPGQMEWLIIISKQADLPGTTGYKDAEDVTRFKVKPETANFTETFTIGFADVTTTSSNIELTWENTKVKFEIKTNPDAKVMQNIAAVLEPSSGAYFAAARYYLESGRDLNQALTWVNKSLEGDEKFWMLRTKALIQAGLGDYKSAIKTAQRSTELAQAAKNEEYVKMNEESVKEWTKKL